MGFFVEICGGSWPDFRNLKDFGNLRSALLTRFQLKIPDTYKLNFHPLDLEVVEVLDFQGVPVLTVEQNHAGFKYLSYLLQYAEGGVEQRLVVPVTDARLDALKSGQISVRDAFNSSETVAEGGRRVRARVQE